MSRNETYRQSYRRERSSNASARSSLGNPRFQADYVVGSAAPAIKEQPARKERHRRVANPFEVFRGGADPRQKAARSTMPNVLKAFVYVVVIFAMIGFVDICLTSAAIVSTAEAESLNSQITQAREEGKAMEVSYGALNNPTSLKDKATKLGMTTSAETIQLNIADDMVVTKSDGSIALASSLKAAANQ